MKRYVGYNAKARGLVGGSSKKRKRVTRESEDAEFNSNAEFLIPKTVEEKEFHHREKLKQEVGKVRYELYRKSTLSIASSS